MMRLPFRLTLALPLLAACGGPTEPGGPPPLLEALPRALTPAELRIVDGANAFAFDLLREAARALPPDSNLLLSPLSASMALGLAMAGAEGETFEAMRSGLRFEGMSESEIGEGYRGLIQLLDGLDSRTEMTIANSIWAREGLALEPAFVGAGRDYFDAEVATLDFTSPAAVETINDWVSDQTGGKIPRLLESIRADEVLFLINAIYFKGQWRSAFGRSDTRSGAFHGADGIDRTADLMRQEEQLLYLETGDLQAVDLLYGNGAYAMTVLLPRPGHSPAELLGGLDAASWRALAAGFAEATVRLTLPRFRLEYARSLNDDLAALGMGVAFDRARADFSGIADVRPERLYLSRVEQKTFVEVNEEGTEAGAATSVGLGETSVPQVFDLMVDRPFAFLIRQRLSGTVLFLGITNVTGQT